jgi:hypothetical protein
MSPLRAPRPPPELPHRATRLRTLQRLALRHALQRLALRHASQRHGTRLRKLPRRGTRDKPPPRRLPKRLAQRRGRLRIPQPGRAALSPQLLPRMAAAMSGHGKTWRRNTTRRHDKA